MKNIALLTINLLISFGIYGQDFTKSETVNLKGKKTYYEVYGSGEPLLFLHGYGGTSKSWRSFISDYQDDFEIYLIDLQGFGNSNSFDPNWSINSVAQNLNDLLEYLKLDSVKAIGFSYGGDVIFQLAHINPYLVKSMISIGAIGSWNALDYPGYVEYFSYSNRANLTRSRENQTSEKQFRAFLDFFTNYNIFLSDKDLQNISTKTMIILGDDDSFPLEEVERVRKNLPNFDLWILPNTGHSAHEGKNLTEFLRVSKEFLKDE